MSAQALVVTVLVLGCSGYAAWTLMPSAARRAIARQLLRLPLHKSLTRPLRRAMQAPSGCGCDGCDHAPAKTPQAVVQPITFQRRIKR